MALLLHEPAVARRPVGVVQVTGPDRLGYLHVMLTQHLESAQPAEVADFAYLDPKGNPLAVGRAVVRADDVLLMTPSPEVAADLASALKKFKFLTQVETRDVSDGWALASVRGPGPADLGPAEPMRASAQGEGEGEGFVIRDRSGGIDLVGPQAWIAETLGSLGLPDASDDDWEAWRISHGEPAWGMEITPGRRLQELGLLPTHVHLRKGCYPGQESIAKIYNRGAPRRALVLLEADGELSVGGEVTSAARAGDRWVGLALLPLTDGELPGEVRPGGVGARVVRTVGAGVPIPGA